MLVVQVLFSELNTSEKLLSQIAPCLFRIFNCHFSFLKLSYEPFKLLVIFGVVADYHMLLVKPVFNHLVKLDRHLCLRIILHPNMDRAAFCA